MNGNRVKDRHRPNPLETELKTLLRGILKPARQPCSILWPSAIWQAMLVTLSTGLLPMPSPADI